MKVTDMLPIALALLLPVVSGTNMSVAANLSVSDWKPPADMQAILDRVNCVETKKGHCEAHNSTALVVLGNKTHWSKPGNTAGYSPVWMETAAKRGQLPWDKLQCHCIVGDHPFQIWGKKRWRFDLFIKGFGDYTAGYGTSICGGGIKQSLIDQKYIHESSLHHWQCDYLPSNHENGTYLRHIKWETSKLFHHKRLPVAFWEASSKQMGSCRCPFNYNKSLWKSIGHGLSFAMVFIPIPIPWVQTFTFIGFSANLAATLAKSVTVLSKTFNGFTNAGLGALFNSRRATMEKLSKLRETWAENCGGANTTKCAEAEQHLKGELQAFNSEMNKLLLDTGAEIASKCRQGGKHKCRKAEKKLVPELRKIQDMYRETEQQDVIEWNNAFEKKYGQF